MRVYLDYAATTPLDSRVLQAMMPYLKNKFGNASSIHFWGQEARKAVEASREKVAELLDCQPAEIYFTGTTTISNNLAIQGVMKVVGQDSHLITSAVEHHAVLDTCQALAKQGHQLSILPVDKYGLINPVDLKKAINKKTILVTVMYANNETGTIQPIKEISRIIKDKRQKTKDQRLFFHTDAAAAVDYLDINVKNLKVDLMTLGAHKFGGPKGIGVLYIRRGTVIQPLIFGGHHEAGLWPGTENVAGIIGLTKALEIASRERKTAVKKVSRLRDRLIKGVLTGVSGAKLTGHQTKRLPDIASFIIKGVEGEAVLLMLSDKGIAASSGSACTSGELKPSHVLTAMGIKPELAHGSLRFSLGKKTTIKDIDYVLEVLPKVVSRLRKMAPKLKDNETDLFR